jgi:hypothetical protein
MRSLVKQDGSLSEGFLNKPQLLQRPLRDHFFEVPKAAVDKLG